MLIRIFVVVFSNLFVRSICRPQEASESQSEQRSGKRLMMIYCHLILFMLLFYRIGIIKRKREERESFGNISKEMLLAEIKEERDKTRHIMSSRSVLYNLNIWMRGIIEKKHSTREMIIELERGTRRERLNLKNKDECLRFSQIICSSFCCCYAIKDSS